MNNYELLNPEYQGMELWNEQTPDFHRSTKNDNNWTEEMSKTVSDFINELMENYQHD